MTREEAINELRNMWFRWKTRSVSEGQAIDMAIKALEQELHHNSLQEVIKHGH